MFGDGCEAFDQSQRDQPVQDSGRFGADRVLDLGVGRSAVGDRMQDRCGQVAVIRLGRDDQLTLGQQASARCAREPRQVVGHRCRLVPPGQVERHPAEQAVYQGADLRREIEQHQGGLVRLERMDLQSKVETAEEWGPLVLKQLHVSYRGAT